MSILETRLERSIPKVLSSDDYVNAGSPAGWSRLVGGGQGPHRRWCCFEGGTPNV